MKALQFTVDDVLLHAQPIFHIHGLFVATNVSLISGGSLVFLPIFDLDAIAKYMPKATSLMSFPTFYARFLDDPRFTVASIAHMQLFISGSALLLAKIHSRFEARTGHRILERYGMTETNMKTSNPYEGDRRAGSVGLPLTGWRSGSAMLMAMHCCNAKLARLTVMFFKDNGKCLKKLLQNCEKPGFYHR